MSEDANRSVRMKAESRYAQFMEHVAEQFSGGRRFLDDVPQEPVADSAELVTAAETFSGSKKPAQ